MDRLRFPPPGIERELVGEFGDFVPDAGEDGVVGAVSEGLVDPESDLAHLGFAHAASGEGRRADADSRGLERRVDVVGDAVLVDGDARFAEGELGFRAEHAGGVAGAEDVDEHDMVVGAAGDDAPAGFLQCGGEDLGVGDDLLRVGGEGGLQGFAEGNGLGGDDVDERAALLAGEDGAVDRCGQIGVAEDETGAGSAECLVGRGGHDLCVSTGVG